MPLNKKYLLIAVIFLIIEILIAVFVHDAFVRPFLGDMLVVILIYTFIKAFIKISYLKAAFIVWIFAILVEVSQHFNLIGILGLQDSEMGKAVLGNSFSWMDILMYSLGIILILFVEKLRHKNASFSACS